MIKRKKQPKFGAQTLHGEYGYQLLISKVEILGPARAQELQSYGMRYIAVVDRFPDDKTIAPAMVFAPQIKPCRETAGLIARALGEAEAGWDITETMAASMAGGSCFVQLSTEGKALLSPWFKEHQGQIDGLVLNENVNLAVGEIPEWATVKHGPSCGCQHCRSRGGWL